MAGAATFSPFITLTSTKLLSSLPPSPTLSSSPIPSLHQQQFTTCRHGSPILHICYGNLNGLTGKEAVGIDEAFFDEEEVMEEEEESDEDDTESSIDLLFRFLHSMFKKVSKRAKKASRSMLPDIISPQLRKKQSRRVILDLGNRNRIMGL
ncbi:unnamed protein product [Ilex paraguariensis]|uniref:Uncharacterized protein n=1 Tax=Ilex paraguariensis TaxID=185542 RepID=A0ABC8UGW8_9AQUA